MRYDHPSTTNNVAEFDVLYEVYERAQGSDQAVEVLSPSQYSQTL